MDKKARNLLIAMLVVLAVVAIAYYWWITKDTVKIAVTGLTVASGGAVTLTGSTASSSDPATWGSKKITIQTKSLGKINSTVAAASAANGVVSVTTAPGAYTGSAAYAAAAGDYARVTLKY